MFNDLITQITPIIQHYGAWGVFFIAIIEEVVVPIPSSFSLLAAGFFLIPTGMLMGDTLLQALLKIGIPSGLGFAIGSMFPYALAYLGGEPIIMRWGKWIGVSWKDVEKANKYFSGSRKDEVMLFILRVLPVVPNGLVSVFCGTIRYSVRNFFIITFLASVVRAFLMGLLGWSLGEAFVIYADQISEFGMYAVYATASITAGFLIAFFVRKYIRKRRAARAA